MPASTGLFHGFSRAMKLKLVQKFYINRQYYLLSQLGSGIYSNVFECVDSENNIKVAVKVTHNADSMTEADRMHEAAFLKKLRNRRVIRLLDEFMWNGKMHLVLSLIRGGNLQNVQREKGAFPLDVAKLYARSLLKVVAFFMEKKVVHGNITPGNIMVDDHDKGSIKMIDFNSCFNEDEPFVQVMGTPGYKAPEALLGLPYGSPIDLWSVGVILAELAVGKRLLPTWKFWLDVPGLTKILGGPPSEMLEAAPLRNMYFDKSGQLTEGCIERMPPCFPLGKFLNGLGSYFQHFIRCLLRWNPEERLTPQKALQHPWVMQAAAAAAQTSEPCEPKSRRKRTWHFVRKSSQRLVSWGARAEDDDDARPRGRGPTTSSSHPRLAAWAAVRNSSPMKIRRCYQPSLLSSSTDKHQLEAPTRSDPHPSRSSLVWTRTRRRPQTSRLPPKQAPTRPFPQLSQSSRLPPVRAPTHPCPHPFGPRYVQTPTHPCPYPSGHPPDWASSRSWHHPSRHSFVRPPTNPGPHPSRPPPIRAPTHLKPHPSVPPPIRAPTHLKPHPSVLPPKRAPTRPCPHTFGPPHIQNASRPCPYPFGHPPDWDSNRSWHHPSGHSSIRTLTHPGSNPPGPRPIQTPTHLDHHLSAPPSVREKTRPDPQASELPPVQTPTHPDPHASRPPPVWAPTCSCHHPSGSTPVRATTRQDPHFSGLSPARPPTHSC